MFFMWCPLYVPALPQKELLAKLAALLLVEVDTHQRLATAERHPGELWSEAQEIAISNHEASYAGQTG